MSSTSEIFFRRKETAREQVSLPAPLFNRCQLLLNRAATAHVFVPVRSMQFQAVIDSDEIIFVDNLGYAVEDGHGRTHCLTGNISVSLRVFPWRDS